MSEVAITASNITTSESVAKIAEALAAAQGAMKAAIKDATNPHFKSNYADLASVWDACREPLSKNGLSVVQPPAGGVDSVTVITMLMHKSGEWIRSELTLRPTQNNPQGIGSAITYGRRYALSGMVGIAPEDDDGNAASEGNGRKQAGTKAESAASKSAEQQKPASNATKPAGIFLDLGGGAGEHYASVSAYLDALESALSQADDAGALFDLNSATLQKIQAKALEKKEGATVGRITAIFDHIHNGTVPGLAA